MNPDGVLIVLALACAALTVAGGYAHDRQARWRQHVDEALHVANSTRRAWTVKRVTR